MVQLKNYLSRKNLHMVKNALLLGTTDEFQALIPWLLKYVQVQKIHYVSPALSHHPYGDAVTLYPDIDALDLTDHIDLLLFDQGNAASVQALGTLAPQYLLGKTEENEDYFTIWETFRGSASSIYIETAQGILEWDRPAADIELSVVIPVYNVSDYLPRCIESLTRWQAGYIEYLFVDDGSPDDSASIVEAYAVHDSRIRLIRKENGGCASARNCGLEAARGRYIGFVDADDFIDEIMYYKLFRRALAGNYDLAYCGYLEYNGDTEASRPAENDCLGMPYLEGTCRIEQVRLLAIHTRVAIWRCLYKRSVLDEAGIRFHEDLKLFDDLPFRIEYLLAARSAVCVPEHLYYYRLGRDGQDVSCTDHRLYVHFDIFDHLDACVDRYRDQGIWDLLQVIKIHTHRYGLSHIDQAYRNDYRRRAKAQIRIHGGYFRNVCLLLMYAGRSHAGWFTWLWLHR